MATWIRQGTGTAPSANDAELVGDYALDNATAPVDFDPAAVTSVRCEWTVTGSGFVDDSWDNGSCAVETGTTEISQHPSTGGTSLQNTSEASDHTDSTGIPTGLSVAEWEAALVRGDGTAVPDEWVMWNKTKGPDGSTLTVSALTVTITYTPTASGTPGSASPSTLSTSASLPASSVSGGGNTSPSAIGTAASVSGPSASGGGSSSPSVISQSASIPAVSPVGSASTSPATTDAGLTIPAASASGSGGGKIFNPFDPDPVLDRTKPGPWNVEQAFISLEYGGLWRRLAVLVPFWEGNHNPVDVASALGTTAQGAAVFWSLTPFGPSMNKSGGTGGDAATEVIVDPSPIWNQSSDQITVVVFALAESVNTGDTVSVAGTTDSNSDGWRLFGIHGGPGGPRWRIPERANLDMSTRPWSAGDAVMWVARADTAGMYLDVFNLTTGQDESVSNTTTGTWSAVPATDGLAIGTSTPDGSASGLEGRYVLFGLWHRSLSDTEVRQVRNDVYGLLRPNWDSTSVAAGGDAATATPGATDLTATLPSSTPSAPASTSPASTSPTLSIPSVSPAGAASSSPSAITSSVVIPQSSPTGGGSVTPAASELAVNLHAVTTATGGSPGTATPGELAAQLSLAQASPVGAANVTPSVLSAALSIPGVTAEGLTLVSPATLETAVSLGQVTLVGGATVTVDALELEVVFAVPVTGEAIDHPTGKTSVTLDASTTDAGVVASITSVTLAKSRTFVSLDKTRTDT